MLKTESIGQATNGHRLSIVSAPLFARQDILFPPGEQREDGDVLAGALFRNQPYEKGSFGLLVPRAGDFDRG